MAAQPCRFCGAPIETNDWRDRKYAPHRAACRQLRDLHDIDIAVGHMAPNEFRNLREMIMRIGDGKSFK